LKVPIQPTHESVFNVVDSFSQALNELRMERGEPVEGLLRQVWKTKLLLDRIQFSVVAGTSVMLLAAAASIVFLRSQKPQQDQTADIKSRLNRMKAT
jgi:hypothetical protein